MEPLDTEPDVFGKAPYKQPDPLLLAETEEPTQGPESDIPEGTLWGWLSVLGALCLSVSTLGYLVSWGTYQAYYEEYLLASSTPSAIAWIGSVQYSLVYLPGMISGHLFDKGYFRSLLAGTSVLFIVASFLIAQCQNYWQFLLCQGFALGIASGFLYVPIVGLVSQWFRVRRPIAFSIISLGVSIGGIIFPIIFRNLLPKLGFAWTVRVPAFINLAMFGAAQFTMFTRLPPNPSVKARPWLNFNDFRSKAFSFYSASTFFAFLGLYTMLTFLSVSASRIGFSSSLSFDLIAISNAASAFGRLFGGVYAIKYGALNALIVFTSIAAITTYVWPFVTSHGGFIALTCVYGASSGAFVGLFPVPTAAFGSIEDVGRRTGLQMSVMALGALAGPPISGAIFNAAGSFKPVGIYAGSAIALSVFLMVCTRVAVLGKLFGGKV